jgi:hypothetical protein
MVRTGSDEQCAGMIRKEAAQARERGESARTIKHRKEFVDEQSGVWRSGLQPQKRVGQECAAALAITQARQRCEPQIWLRKPDAREREGDAMPRELRVPGDVINQDEAAFRRGYVREIQNGWRRAIGQKCAQTAKECGFAAATGAGEENECGVGLRWACGIDARKERLCVGE